MKLEYPVDNEQIFLPNNIDLTKMGNADSDNGEGWEGLDPDDSGDSSEEDSNSINIKFTNIANNAIFFAHYFHVDIEYDYNVFDIINVFFDLVKRHTDLRYGPISLIDPGIGVNNFACWYEFDAEESMNEVNCKMVKNIQMFYTVDLSDDRLDNDIAELLKEHAIYYEDNEKYYIATYCAIYALYDYLKNFKDRVVNSGKYLVSVNAFEKNTIIARRKVVY